MSDNDDSAAAAEARFRAQAAALAQALRAADEAATATPATGTPQDTYRQLCFDDPTVSSAECQALAKALIAAAADNNYRSSSKQQQQPDAALALSNRFVAGVAQLCQRNDTTHHGDKKDAVSTAESIPTTTETTSLLTPPPPPSASHGGYALLAWTVYGHLPLMILLSNHLAQASAWIGSFRAPEDSQTSLQNDHDEEEEAFRKKENAVQEEEIATKTTGPVLAPAPNSSNNDEGDIEQDSLQEVWAAESDPSDYDYGTEPSPAERLAELEAWTNAFTVEPTELSQPRSDTTWLHVADTVTFLLQQLKYSTALAGISVPTMWKTFQISAKLTQCTLALLLPFTLKSTPLLAQHPEHHWQQLALHPLHAFRDAAEEHPAFLNEDYLNLLVLLIQAHHATSSSGSAARPTEITPATLVGLGALATLCNATVEKRDTSHIKLIQETIVRVADDLTTVLEMAENDNAVVPWTFLSLWHVLSWSQQHGLGLTNTQAQMLLQSGLVRQWMMTWQQTKSSNDDKKSYLQKEIERSILYLACVAPTTIGKYAWRFAQFAGHVTTFSSSGSPFSETVFLWNLVGSHLAEIAGGSGLVSLKKKSATTAAPAPTASMCQRQTVQVFQAHCQGIVQTLSSWKDKRTNQVAASSSGQGPELEEDTKQSLESFHAIVNALSLPLVRKLFLEKFIATDGFDVAEVLAPIRKLLVSWPTPKTYEDTKENNAAEEIPESLTAIDKGGKSSNDDDNDDDGEAARPKRRRGRVEVEDEAVAAIRKSIKVLQSTLDSAGQLNTGRLSSKAD